MTHPSDLEGLSKLGKPVAPSRKLETFPNHHPGRPYLVRLETDEFTCVCPATGQPDFAALTVEYVPAERILESKAFKLYLWSFRDEGAFHEHVTNVILDDLVAALEPVWCRVEAEFAVRGGIGITVVAEHGLRSGTGPEQQG
ncbi:MAG: preQ(1) synthase [Anaerolineae bacterium]